MKYINPIQIVSVVALHRRKNMGYYKYLPYRKWFWPFGEQIEGWYLRWPAHVDKPTYRADDMPDTHERDGEILYEKPRVYINMSDDSYSVKHFDTYEKACAFAKELKERYNLIEE